MKMVNTNMIYHKKPFDIGFSKMRILLNTKTSSDFEPNRKCP